MKTVNVTFTDEEYEQLLTKKNSKNWHDFILQNTLHKDVQSIIDEFPIEVFDPTVNEQDVALQGWFDKKKKKKVEA